MYRKIRCNFKKVFFKDKKLKLRWNLYFDSKIIVRILFFRDFLFLFKFEGKNNNSIKNKIIVLKYLDMFE